MANASMKYHRQSKIGNVATANQSCPICNDDHFLHNCLQVKELDVDKRKEVISKNKLCFNCLKGKHISNECKSGHCKVCGRRHNTLLHMGDSVLVAEIGQQSHSDENSTTIKISQQVNRETTLLPMAIVMVRDKNNSRALIGSGAQSRLQLPKSHDNTELYGVGGEKPNYTKGTVQLEIFAEKHNRTFLIKTYCLQKLTQYLSTHTIQSKRFDYFRNHPLAKQAFHHFGSIRISTLQIKRLQSMERKFMKNEDLIVELLKFMDEYKEFNHMEATPSDIRQAYYMPHHAVIKPISTTNKLRVVFDAS